MSSPIFVVAKNTFIEMIRDRVLYFVVVFSILFMGLCFALGQLSYNEIFRLSVSLGLSGIHFCFMGLAIFLGCSVFFREIERKTIYTLLARPLSRGQYLLGKYLGLLSVLLTLLFGFVLCFTLVEYLLAMPILLTSYYAFVGFFFEAAILLSVTFFFASFSKPFLSITGSLAFFLIGHWVASLEAFIEKSTSVSFYLIGQVIIHTFPNLEALNWRPFAISQSPVPAYELSFAFATAALWALFFFMLSLIIFRRKDFE